MAEQNRATPQQWKEVKEQNYLAFSCLLELRDRVEALEAKEEGNNEAWAARLRRPGRSQAERIASLAERITSLVKRIEALESAASTEVRPTVNARITRDRDETGDYLIVHDASPNHPELPDSSLVHRVARVMNGATEWQVRAAIREVAAWLREHFLQGFDPHSAGGWAMRLEQEAER